MGDERYWKVYWAVRKAVRDRVNAKVNEIADPVNHDLLGSAVGLLDRMLPADPIVLPVIDLELAKVVCAAPAEAAA